MKRLEVLYHDRTVGTLALYKDRLAAFEYHTDWIADGFSISPFSLPLERKVFLPQIDPFEGLFGIFADSLPDGWGRLLTDRLMLSRGMDPHRLASLDRLAIVGSSGMGALTYRPVISIERSADARSLDEIAAECSRLLQTEYTDDLDHLFAGGGSSGGARPKILTTVDGEDWIIKFPGAGDRPDAGREEYDYACCAKKCGIAMEEVRLFPSKTCGGYFGTRRFDRVHTPEGVVKRHMASVAALLETSHRMPNLDYTDLLRLTLMLTGSIEECWKLFRLMCFNVYAHNRDDHSKNFSFLYLDEEKRWILAPAYDLTYSSSIGGEHATTINGNGAAPAFSDLLAAADTVGLSRSKARSIAAEVKECVEEKLGDRIRERG